MPLSLEIITPIGVVYSSAVEYVYIPGAEGELGFLPGHEPLMTTLVPGELRCKVVDSPHEEFLVVGSGFVKIANDKLAIVTDLALDDSQIDEQSAEKAMAAAQEALKNQSALSKEEHARFEAQLAKQIALLNFKKKKHTRRNS